MSTFFNRPLAASRVLLVTAVTLALLVPVHPVTAADADKPTLVTTLKELPAPVQRMREAILAAVAAGDIELMREALEMNELMPLIDGEKRSDPIAYWRSLSIDGSGHDVLALFGDLLALPPARLANKDGGDSYVWPYLAEWPLASLQPGEIVALYRLAPASEAAAMLKAGRYSFFRMTIGADGTWHSFDRVTAN